MFPVYVFELFSSSHNKTSPTTRFAQSTYPGVMNCIISTSVVNSAAEMRVDISTRSGTGAGYTVWVLGQSIESLAQHLEFQLTQSATFTGLTNGDKYTIIVLSRSEGVDNFVERRQEFTHVSEPAQPIAAEEDCFQSTETSITFCFTVQGICHGFYITLVQHTPQSSTRSEIL